MGFAITTFLVLFLLIASGGLLLFYREAMLQRISEVINPNAKPKIAADFNSSSLGFRWAGLSSTSTACCPRARPEVSVVKQRLIRAGYRKESTIKIFYGSKVVIPILLCMLAWSPGSER